jgi:hypothetical protein
MPITGQAKPDEEKYLDEIIEPTAESPDESGAEASGEDQTSEKDTESTEGVLEASADKPEKAAKKDPANSPDRPDGYVPKQALEESRAETRRAEGKIQSFLDRFYYDQESKQAEAQPAAPPTIDDDPLGVIGHQGGRIEGVEARLAQMEQGQREQNQQNELLTLSAQDVTAYAQEVPEVTDAIAFLQKRGPEMLREQGYETPVQLEAGMRQWEAYLTQQALNMGVRPAQYLHHYAQMIGHQQATPAPAEAVQAANQESAPSTGQFTEQQDRNKQIAESQDRNASLSQAAGGAAPKRMTPKEFAKLDEAEMWRHFGGSRRNRDFDHDMGFTP